MFKNKIKSLKQKIQEKETEIIRTNEIINKNPDNLLPTMITSW